MIRMLIKEIGKKQRNSDAISFREALRNADAFYIKARQLGMVKSLYEHALIDWAKRGPSRQTLMRWSEVINSEWLLKMPRPDDQQ